MAKFSKKKVYINLNKLAWDNVSNFGELDSYTSIVRKNTLGRLLSLCGKLQFKLLEGEVASFQSLPHVVITGHWRSGTTYLHTLLSCDLQFTFCSTDACMNPHTFMLGTPKGASGKTKRPMDEVQVTADSPQEDEFALLALGARSPYEGLMFPKSLSDALALGDPADLLESERRTWERIFCDFIKGISLVGARRAVVVKSPTHSYRVEAISKLLPNAKFISIRRNPLEVFESTFRMWKVLFNLYSLGGALEDDDLREIILNNRIVMEQKLSDGLAALPADKVAHVQYERLVNEPLKELRNLYEQLNLDPGFLTSELLAQQISQSRLYRAGNNVPSPVWQDRIRSKWGDFF